MDLLWDAPPFESQNGLIRGYIVEIRELETGLIFQLTTNSSNISVLNLLPFYNYTCVVAAETIAVGPVSIEIAFTLPEGGKLSSDTICFKTVCFFFASFINYVPCIQISVLFILHTIRNSKLCAHVYNYN